MYILEYSCSRTQVSEFCFFPPQKTIETPLKYTSDSKKSWNTDLKRNNGGVEGFPVATAGAVRSVLYMNSSVRASTFEDKEKKATCHVEISFKMLKQVQKVKGNSQNWNLCQLKMSFIQCSFHPDLCANKDLLTKERNKRGETALSNSTWWQFCSLCFSQG